MRNRTCQRLDRLVRRHVSISQKMRKVSEYVLAQKSQRIGQKNGEDGRESVRIYIEYTLNDNLNFKFEYTVISCNFWLGPLITALKSPWRSPPGLARHPEPLSMLSMLSTTQPTEPLMGEKWSCASWYAWYATSVIPHSRWFHVFQRLDNLVGLGSILKSTNSSCDQAVSTKQVWSWEEWLKKLLDRKMQPTRPFASNLSQWLSDSASSRVDPEEATARSSVPRISTQSRLFWLTLPNISIAREWESLWSCQHHISKFSPFWSVSLSPGCLPKLARPDHGHLARVCPLVPACEVLCQTLQPHSNVYNFTTDPKVTDYWSM